MRENAPEPDTTFVFKFSEAASEDLLTEGDQPVKIENIPVQSGKLSLWSLNPRMTGEFYLPFGSEQSGGILDPTTEDLVNGKRMTKFHGSILSSGEGFFTRTAPIYLNDAELLKTDPGIYRYVVEEIQGDEIGETYDGMKYDTNTKYYVDVFIYANNLLPKFVVTKCDADSSTEESDTSETSKEKNHLKFTNDFSGDGKTDPALGTRTVTLEKVLEGNLANPDDEFTFDVQILSSNNSTEYYTMILDSTLELTAPEGTPIAEELVNIKRDTEASRIKYTIPANTEITISKMKAGDFAEIYGLSPNDGFLIDEADPGSLGYTKAAKLIIGETVQDGWYGLEAQAGIAEDAVVTWTNTRKVEGPTGLLITWAPYIALAGLAGVGGVLMFRKRKSNET